MDVDNFIRNRTPFVAWRASRVDSCTTAVFWLRLWELTLHENLLLLRAKGRVVNVSQNTTCGTDPHLILMAPQIIINSYHIDFMGELITFVFQSNWSGSLRTIWFAAHRSGTLQDLHGSLSERKLPKLVSEAIKQCHWLTVEFVSRTLVYNQIRSLVDQASEAFKSTLGKFVRLSAKFP